MRVTKGGVTWAYLRNLWIELILSKQQANVQHVQMAVG